MIETIIRVVVVGIVLYIVWLALSIVLTFLPAMVMTLVGVVLALGFCVYILRAFNIKF